MKSLPFQKLGQWYRGNLHTHSTRSDGRKTSSEVCASYRRAGYSFISLTDHILEAYGWLVTVSQPYCTDGFTTIFGAELHTPKTSLGDLWHLLAVGLPLDFVPKKYRESGATRLGTTSRTAMFSP